MGYQEILIDMYPTDFIVFSNLLLNPDRPKENSGGKIGSAVLKPKSIVKPTIL